MNQQIHLTPIVQSLKASDPKNNPFTSEITMMTHTATHASTAITSSQPAPSSSRNSSTTPQQLCDQLQQILRRHGGGPNGPGGPGGPEGPGRPNQPNPATPQQPKADDFINKVKAYLCLNADVTGYDSPFKKVAFTLTLIKGESTAQWVRHMGNWLDGLVLPRDNIPGL